MAAAEFDYIVVGAGSAGAALAARLGEAADRTTCVIEAGGQDTHPFIHIPSFVAAAIGREATNWRFKTVPQPGMAGREIPVPRGRVLGGSGSINGMVYFRGHPTDYDDWADAGATGWSYAEVLPYFTRTENNENYPGERVPRRTAARSTSSTSRGRTRSTTRSWTRSPSLQFPACPDFNGPNPEGYGRRQGLMRNGAARDHRQEHAPPGAGARQHPCPDRCAGGAGAGREGPRDRRRADRRARDPRAARGDPLGRHGADAADPDALAASARPRISRRWASRSCSTCPAWARTTTTTRPARCTWRPTTRPATAVAGRPCRATCAARAAVRC